MKRTSPPLQRREFITLIGGTAVAWPVTALAQQPERVRRIGVLGALAADDPESVARIAAFLQRSCKGAWTGSPLGFWPLRMDAARRQLTSGSFP